MMANNSMDENRLNADSMIKITVKAKEITTLVKLALNFTNNDNNHKSCCDVN